MLINFSVANYKCFNSIQTLNLTANYDRTHIDNTFKVVDHDILKSVVIYGANQSGKSCLLNAIGFMQRFILQGARYQANNIVEFTEHTRPIFFEIKFSIDDCIYKYGFKVYHVDRISQEWLYVYETSRPQLWFKRSFRQNKNEYKWEFGGKLKGQIKLLKEQTANNNLFLSQAARLNNIQLKPVYEWFEKLYFLDIISVLNKHEYINEKFWIKHINNNDILIVDDLMNNIHPNFAKFIVNIFHDKEINKNNSQLIFTSHNTNLLDLEIFRRDQIWFTDNKKNKYTDLYCLSDFNPRKTECIEKGYLKGRYDAIPHIDETILT